MGQGGTLMYQSFKKACLALADGGMALFAKCFPRWHLESQVNREIRRTLEAVRSRLEQKTEVRFVSGVEGTLFVLDDPSEDIYVSVAPILYKNNESGGPTWIPEFYVHVWLDEIGIENEILEQLRFCAEQFGGKLVVNEYGKEDYR